MGTQNNDDEKTIDKISVTNPISKNNKRKSPSDDLVPSTVKVSKSDGKKDVKVKPDDGIVIEKVKKTWCKKMSSTHGDLRKKDFDTLSKFGQLQDVLGDRNYGVYATIEGLFNCVIAVTTDVETFRNEVYGFIYTHQKEVLTNFIFSGKFKKD